ncbi:ABC transporter permease [Inquilinus sp. CAU 1745]|uniref:ABC transporter permease n=1 Tax=Inquilinus sp. CAU 1745 TaxID=3140369 RepID=UPI00325B19EE
MENKNSIGARLLVGLLFIFLLAPVLLVFPMSFSGDPYLSFPPSSWSLRWYQELPTNSVLVGAFWTSLSLAAVVTLLSLAIAIPAAYAITRISFPGREPLFALFTAPLLLPTIVLGLAILIVFVEINLVATFHGLILAHLVITLPYALRVLATALGTLPPSVEEAASTLGAHSLTVFRRITLPLMTPGIVAASALCFLVSFDEVVISLFVVGPSITTLPVELYRYVDTRSDPLVAAASVFLIVGTIGIIMIVERSMGLNKALNKG